MNQCGYVFYITLSSTTNNFYITIHNSGGLTFIARRAYSIVENNASQTRYLVEVKGCHPKNQIEIVRHILFHFLKACRDILS